MDEQIRQVIETYHRMIEERKTSTSPQTDNGKDMRMMPVGPDTGRFINLLAKSLDKPRILELGTSLGYSGIWLGETARATGGRLVTMENLEHKSAFARDMAEKAGLAEVIDFRVGDAVTMIDALPDGIDFVLLDLWKDLYVPCLDAFYPKLNPGAIIVADNMIYPGGENVDAYARAVRTKPGMSSVLLPVGSGLEVSRLESR